MVEISLSGSGEGPGWVTAPGYSTAGNLPWGSCRPPSAPRAAGGPDQRAFRAPRADPDERLCARRGIAVRTDHSQPDQVEALFERVRSESGRLDVLVNDIGGEDLTEWKRTSSSTPTRAGRS